MNKLTQRIKTYSQVSTTMAAYSDQQLSALLDKAEPLYTGIGGTAALLEIENTKIFVKRIPLTDLERQPQNVRSTANLFELPFSYHIGVGSAGFSSWRELFVHMMTTNWVISNECQNFPILYHWRMLPTTKPKPMNAIELEKLENDVKYWDNSPAVRKRLEAMHTASAHVYLFLEYVPQTLDQWLRSKLIEGGEVTTNALDFVDIKLKETNKFMNAQGLIHFDAHFDNILADDDTIYFSDFGLSLSNRFENSNDELKVFDEYKLYDQCSTATNFLHSIIASLLGKDRWQITLKDVPNDQIGELEQPVANIIKRYAGIALVMANFYQNMQKVSKSTSFPVKQLKDLITELVIVEQEKTFEIYNANQEDVDHIRKKIVEFNSSKVPFTQDEEIIYQNYIIKDHGKIIAGIEAIIYLWGILYVDVLFVNENYRKQNLGSKLLAKVENEARLMGANMAHLDTFDFQAKDFYIKNGYTVFGVMEDCPIGHKRYYFSKRL